MTAMFPLAERPALYPGVTVLGNTDGPVVDCGELPSGGRVYLGRLEADEIARHFPSSETLRLRARVDELILRVNAAEAELGRLRSVADAIRHLQVEDTTTRGNAATPQPSGYTTTAA